MNKVEKKYTNFAIVKEMLETPAVIKNFRVEEVEDFASLVKESGTNILMTGEGSSRIMPARHTIYQSMLQGNTEYKLYTYGCRDAMKMELKDYIVFGVSNSGKTKELISLFKQLKEKEHKSLLGVTANKGSLLEEISDKCFILKCGKEEAVAATKSVVEQVLFYHALLSILTDNASIFSKLNKLAELAEETLTLKISSEIIDIVAKASVIYFAGSDNGVAEELTLKTNETTRKKSGFLEGTYAVHGIEEVMDKNEVVIWVDPYPEEFDKFKEVLVDGVGLNVITISHEDTPFLNIKIPSLEGFNCYLELLAGWNLLIEVGIKNGINLDKPQRARKIGNEFIG